MRLAVLLITVALNEPNISIERKKIFIMTTLDTNMATKLKARNAVLI